MIESNKLRIGNLVHSDFSEENVKTVVEIRHKMASVKYIRTDTNEPHQSMVDYERLIPIQLTEEWLLKAGFEKLTSIEKGFKLNSYTYGRGFSFIVHLNNGLLSTNFWQGNEKKFVHQLQNLFFSLTGEDLVFSTEP